MPLFYKSSDPLFGIWKIEESVDELSTALADDQELLSGLDRNRPEVRQKEWLAVRVLLKELSGKSRLISYHPNGAPFLADHAFQISISHTKGYAALLLQQHPAAGIDIEYKSERVRKIRSRFMSESEEAALDLQHETEHLLIYWCAKETLFKMIGQQEVDFRHHLHVLPFPFAAQGSFEVQETRTAQPQYFRLGYRIEEDFVVTFSL